MNFTMEDYKSMLRAVRAEHRAIGNMTDDLRRLDVLGTTIQDLRRKQHDLLPLIEKLQKITGEIPA